MTDDEIARLRVLAQAAHRAESERAAAAMLGDIRGLRLANEARLEFRAAASPDVLLRLLDERDALRRERDEARAHLSAVLRHPARIRTGVMAAGYVGGACEHSPGERAKVTLFYEGAETAEAAFEHITEAIDALGEGHDGRDGGA